MHRCIDVPWLIYRLSALHIKSPACIYFIALKLGLEYYFLLNNNGYEPTFMNDISLLYTVTSV